MAPPKPTSSDSPVADPREDTLAERCISLPHELVILDEIDFESISHEIIRQRRKNTLKLHLSDYWSIPSENDADFAYHMEDVLDLYHEPYDETRPVVCFDESSKALRGHESDPLPARPRAIARVDHRYDHNGKERIHLATEPLTGWVNVEITERRRTTELINRMVELADDHYTDADCIRVVVDQLITHSPAGFYQFFPPDEAQAYLDRFEFHYIPKNGSRLNMAKIALVLLHSDAA